MINVVTGSSVADLEELGDPLAHAHDERYERAGEYLEVMRQAWTGAEGLTPSEFGGAQGTGGEIQPFQGKYYQFSRPVSSPRTVQRPHPPFYLGGSSRAAKETAIRHAETFLMWGSPTTGSASRSRTWSGFAPSWSSRRA